MKKLFFILMLVSFVSINVYSIEVFPIEFGLKYGYIDENLNVHQMPIYDSASKFVDGVAVVKKDGKFHIINEKFETIASIEAKYAGKPSCNHIWFSDGKNRYYTDYSGKIVATGFSNVNDFHNGYAVVEINKQIYLMDENNNLNRDFNKYTECYYAGDRFYSVKSTDQKYGIVDETGKVIIPLTYDRALSYAGKNLFAFYTGKRMRFDYIGYIDMNNQVVLPAIYQDGYVIENVGFLLQIDEQDKWGTWKLTDTDGKTLYTFPENTYIVNLARKNIVIYYEVVDKKVIYGCMSITGEKIIEPSLNNFYNFVFENGYAQAVYDDKNVLVTEDGEIIYVYEIFGLEPVQPHRWG